MSAYSKKDDSSYFNWRSVECSGSFRSGFSSFLFEMALLHKSYPQKQFLSGCHVYKEVGPLYRQVFRERLYGQCSAILSLIQIYVCFPYSNKKIEIESSI